MSGRGAALLIRDGRGPRAARGQPAARERRPPPPAAAELVMSASGRTGAPPPPPPPLPLLPDRRSTGVIRIRYSVPEVACFGRLSR